MTDSVTGMSELASNYPALVILAVAAMCAVVVLSGWIAGRRARAAVDPLAEQMSSLARSVETLSQGQASLTGSLRQLSESQANTQSQMMNTLETRLDTVTQRMGQSLHENATKTAGSLSELKTRLEVIDAAQKKIEKLSTEVVSLQDILANKQARGAFGEVQLNDIVASARSWWTRSSRWTASTPSARRRTTRTGWRRSGSSARTCRTM